MEQTSNVVAMEDIARSSVRWKGPLILLLFFPSSKAQRFQSIAGRSQSWLACLRQFMSPPMHITTDQIFLLKPLIPMRVSFFYSVVILSIQNAVKL